MFGIAPSGWLSLGLVSTGIMDRDVDSFGLLETRPFEGLVDGGIGCTLWDTLDSQSPSSWSLFLTFAKTACELQVLGPGWALPIFSFRLHFALRF